MRYLLRNPDVRTVGDALAIARQYVDEARLPVKTRLALEELLPRS